MKKIEIVICTIICLTMWGFSDESTHQHQFPQRVVKKGEPLKNQTICPVMGGEIDSTYYAIYKRNVVFFCCKGCIDAFKKGEKYYISVLKRFGEKPMYVKKRKKK